LTDEEGKEQDFELLGSEVVDGTLYVALVPVGEESDVYVILKQTTDENGEDFLITIEDDEEFDRVADILEDKLFDEVDYDEK
jgi:uncharacterized protein YrzB (UPF0473 family)